LKSTDYLDQLQVKKGLKNDVALCKLLNWSSGKISQYRSGKRIMDNEACVALALELEIDPLKIIMTCDMERARKTGQKSLWEVFTMRTAQQISAVLALCFVTSFLTPTPAEAANMRVSEGSKLTCYKLCEIMVVYSRENKAQSYSINEYSISVNLILNICCNAVKLEPSPPTPSRFGF